MSSISPGAEDQAPRMAQRNAPPAQPAGSQAAGSQAVGSLPAGSSAAAASAATASTGSVAATATPTRDHDSENFPTASRLLAPEVRGQVMAFYRFVRTADDIADSATLPPEEKLRRLDAMGAALADPATTMPEAAGMHATGMAVHEANAMLTAFRRDAVQNRYADWAALEEYCRYSANPVGHMLLRLHGADTPEGLAASDGLCTALQVLNHLQDLQQDRDALNRVYLPEAWMALAGSKGADGEAAFFDPQNTTRRRAVLDAALDRVDEELERANNLARIIAASSRPGSKRMAWQAAMTLHLAWALAAKLRAADPLLGRVKLGKADFARALLAAPRLGPSDAALVYRKVARSGSSFGRGMRVLKGDARRGMWAVYAFCRAVDDIADGATPEEEKRRFLADWRRKLVAPDCALSRELAWAQKRFSLPMGELEAMIAGMETDATEHLRLPDEAALTLYCRRVAGSVGALSVCLFGEPRAEAWGLELGHTFQLTNILRDVDEDAARDRVYIPRSLLAEAGIPEGPPKEMLAHPAFPALAMRLARQAEAGYAAAAAEMGRYDQKALRPALVMMWAYRRILARLIARGFEGARPRASLSRGEKLRLACFALGLPGGGNAV